MRLIKPISLKGTRLSHVEGSTSEETEFHNHRLYLEKSRGNRAFAENLIQRET